MPENIRLTLHSQLAAFVRRKPVTATPETALREVVELMSEQRVGSIVIVEPESGKPIGIFTLRDLLHRVAARDCDLEQMIVSVMSDSGLLMLNWRGTAYQAAILMARHGVHHVIVVDSSGRLAGVVSQSDILDVERGGAKAISGAIRSARDSETLVAVSGEIRRMGEQMLAEGGAAEPLTQLISTLNDHLTLRLIEQTMQDFALPRVEWCWLAFGSEGRFEQTFSTDQDNGIIFRAPAGEAAAIREAFLPFARAVNEKLDACGFTLCKGNIMASNPELCLSLEEWRERFGSWLHAASPAALLNATIFFDFRPLYGAEDLAEELRAWLLSRTAGGGASLFLRFMAENAVKAAPPLGVIRDFVFDKSEEFPRTLDLKAFGSRPFVDAARILALANGVGETGTTQRLRAVAEKANLGREDIHAIIDGFFFIQQLRLRIQRDGSPAGQANRVDPDQLNELDRHVLKEAFKQARKLQGRLQLDYRL